MKTLDTFLLIAYVATNAFALVLIVGSSRWPSVTRLLFFLLFAMAAVVNSRTVLSTPWVYQSYADYAIPVYRQFILGPFDGITAPMMLGIAVGQMLIAVSMFSHGVWLRVGCFGGILFCLAISPLGAGAAFPATLLMAVAFYRLYKHECRETFADLLKHPRMTMHHQA